MFAGLLVFVVGYCVAVVLVGDCVLLLLLCDVDVLGLGLILYVGC